jgi:hypothetical protein
VLLRLFEEGEEKGRCARRVSAVWRRSNSGGVLVGGRGFGCGLVGWRRPSLTGDSVFSGVLFVWGRPVGGALDWSTHGTGKDR